MLIDVESRYTDFEWITLALRVAAKKLCPYFQAHTIHVLSSYLIRAFLHKHEAAGRHLNWAIELSEFDIMFRPRTTIKGQVLPNFIVELTDVSEDIPLGRLWILEIDKSSNE